MSVNTANAYGRITVTEEAIAQVAGFTALECYGIVDLVSKKMSDNLADLFNKRRISRGVQSADGRRQDLYRLVCYH